MLSPLTRRRIVAGSAVLYLMFIVAVAAWPTPVDRPISGQVDRALAYAHDPVGVPVVVDYSFVEFTMNIALFVPAGLLVALLLPARRWWLVAVFGGLFSLLIEVAQAHLLPVRHYAWGSSTHIPKLCGLPQTGEPGAEMWLGPIPRTHRDSRTAAASRTRSDRSPS